MNAVSLAELEERLDSLTTALLMPLRMSKILDDTAMNGVRQLLLELRSSLAHEQFVSKTLVGKLYFIFTSMLAEADHAKSPAPIVAAAWEIEEQLTRIFGPHFGPSKE